MGDASNIQPVLGDFGNIIGKIQEETNAQIAMEDEAEAIAARRGSLLGLMVQGAYMVAAADGAVSGDEYTVLAEALSRATNEVVPLEQINAHLDDACARTDEADAATCIAECGDIIVDEEERRAAMWVACAVAWKDGGIGTKQGLALQALARAFEIPINEMHKILANAKS